MAPALAEVVLPVKERSVVVTLPAVDAVRHLRVGMCVRACVRACARSAFMRARARVLVCGCMSCFCAPLCELTRVCLCVRERERERECVCVFVSECMRECVSEE